MRWESMRGGLEICKLICPGENREVEGPGMTRKSSSAGKSRLRFDWTTRRESVMVVAHLGVSVTVRVKVTFERLSGLSSTSTTLKIYK